MKNQSQFSNRLNGLQAGVRPDGSERTCTVTLTPATMPPIPAYTKGDGSRRVRHLPYSRTLLLRYVPPRSFG
jgi:hypothetical protein